MISNGFRRQEGTTLGVKCCGGIVKVKHKRKLIEKGGSCYVCIPSRVRRALGWKGGEILVLYRVKRNGFYVFSENGVDGGPEDIKGPDGLVHSIFQGPKVKRKSSIKIPDYPLKREAALI
jgi:hypothetical protein